MKTCSGCRLDKSLDDFAKSGKSKDGRQYTCRECQRKRWNSEHPDRIREYRRRSDEKRAPRQREAMARRYRENPEHVRSIQYKHRYGITVADYDRLLAEQNGGCAICRTPPGVKRLHVDHDHATGVVRGLLCHRCNHGIGQFLEQVDLLVAAAEYLIA